ncbi:hypothetical protein SFC65_19985 [Priestia filamentosa]|uniref:hypothetical protein n=1 Tax=Priestia filamentosa TaxID=1402861 RepID=UPI003981FB85
MLLKRFVVNLVSIILTIALLYLMGYLFNIPILSFHYEYTHNTATFSVSGGSLLPLIIGLVIGFFAEKLFIYRCRKKA